MIKEDIIKLATNFLEESEGNRISKEIALSEQVVGMRIYDEPLFACGTVNDPLFQVLQEPAAVGPHFMLPQEWLPEAKTVISFFLPFTETVKKRNSLDMSWPSEEWLHARIEGQAVLAKLCQYLQAELIKAGYKSVVPAIDPRFLSKGSTSYPDSNSVITANFTSNWSERHVAYLCGLGTFGLSKGLITKKGIAGRFGSIITELDLQPDVRAYQGVYEYCSMCGACVKNCPVQAISLKEGKNHPICSDFLDSVKEKCVPRYGCGKCQVRVPCESRIPKQLSN